MTPGFIGTADLARRLNPLIAGEIASIGALDTAIQQEDDPGYVVVYRTAKTEKQANLQQMITLLRMVGEIPRESGGLAEPLLKLQTLLLQKVGTTPTLRAMRLAEETLVAGYRTQIDAMAGLPQRSLARALTRALKQWHVLTAHLARRSGDLEEADRLPHPLSQYFATGQARVCIRCLLDRPGALPPLERRDPHPYTWICSACHQEVLEDLPPDLRVQAERWPAELRHDRIIERATGRPQKLKAAQQVLAVLSGVEPEVPLPATERTKELAERHSRGGELYPAPLPVLETAPESASPSERTYTELLFDFRSVWQNW